MTVNKATIKEKIIQAIERSPTSTSIGGYTMRPPQTSNRSIAAAVIQGGMLGELRSVAFRSEPLSFIAPTKKNQHPAHALK